MNTAFDYEKNIVYVEDYAQLAEKYDIFCPGCKEKLIFKNGDHNRAYFSHKPNSNCPYKKEDDQMSAWHIRMQAYFPSKMREYWFEDPVTGEPHRVDVYLQENNTVIEFQHSKISPEEYKSRNEFHLSNGRRIVWVFDQAAFFKELEYQNFSIEMMSIENGKYADRTFEWKSEQREALAMDKNRLENFLQFSLWFSREENGKDIISRVVVEHEDFRFITLSLGSIEMSKDMSANHFFNLDPYHLEKLEEAKKALEILNASRKMTYRIPPRIVVSPNKGAVSSFPLEQQLFRNQNAYQGARRSGNRKPKQGKNNNG